MYRRRTAFQGQAVPQLGVWLPGHASWGSFADGLDAGNGSGTPVVRCPVDASSNQWNPGYKMDDSSRQLLLATFAYLVFMGCLIGTLGAAFGG